MTTEPCDGPDCASAPQYECHCERCAKEFADEPKERYWSCAKHLDLNSRNHLTRTLMSAIWFPCKEAPAPVFAVRMSANSRVRGVYRTKEATTPDEAEKEALAHPGDVNWSYDGTDDDSIEVDSVEKIQ